MMEAYGAQVHYYEAAERRQVGSKQTDTPGRLGVYVGRSQVINGGHRVIPIEWDHRTQQWKLYPTVDRAYIVVDNSKYPLRTVPEGAADLTKLDPARMEAFVHRMSPAAMVPDVYVVDKVLDIRTKAGATEYKVKWRGYKVSESTWEPKSI